MNKTEKEARNIFGLIGYPLSHSFSEAYFKSKFEALKLKDHVYLNFSIPSIERLPEILESYSGLKGFNVTIPFKEQIISYLNETSYVASEVGAVNTVCITNRGLVGYNTDVYGFRQSLLNTNFELEGKRALILGTGGASKAVSYVFTELNIPFRFVSRKEENQFINYRHLDKDLISMHDLIVNTTPLGMFPNENQFPDIPYEYLSGKHFLFDLIYNPEKSLFLKKGEAAGATVKNGLKMLRLQAEKSWEIWNYYNKS